jgi:hypothetical protein
VRYNAGALIGQWPFVQSQQNSQWEMAPRGSSGYEIVTLWCTFPYFGWHGLP